MTASSKPDDCFYLDDDGVVFSVSAFIDQNGLADNARLQVVITEELRQIFPDIRILEEMN